MASDETGDRAKGPGAAWTPRRIEQEIRALQRKQLHQRERLLLLQQGLNSLAEAMKDHPGLDYPEELKPITYLEGSRKDVLFLSFGGVRLGAGIPPAEFHASLSGRDVPGYFIKDFRQSWYQEGLLGLSSDVASTAAVLKALIERHSPRHVVTLGVSAGGYAAILFGALLGVDRVAAFSPQTDVSHQVVKLYAGYDTPPPRQFAGEEGAASLEKVLKSQLRLPEIRVYYGADHELDARTAHGLSGLPGVHLAPQMGVDAHPVTADLKRSGKLNAILGRLVSFEGQDGATEV
jgi:hypothetical protein